MQLKIYKAYSVWVLFLSLSLLPFLSCSKKEKEEALPLSDISQFETFTLDPGLNKGLSQPVNGIISKNTITLPVPYGVDLNDLVASFTYQGVAVKVKDKEQVSGVTRNSFASELVYSVIAESGLKTDYTVSVIRGLARIPSIYISTEGLAAVTSKDNYLKATVELEDPDKLYTNGQRFTATARIKGRGNSTWNMPKKPYRLNLDSKAPLLGMSNDKDWALLANYADKTLLRNITAFQIARIAGMSWVPTSISADLYLNGVYRGVYSLTEHVKVSDERLDMNLVTASDNAGEALTGGYLLELDFHYDEPYKFKTNLKQLPILFKDPDEPTVQQYNYVRDFFNTAETVLYGANFRDPQNGYRRYIDMESFINYYIVQELAKNVDGNLRGSCYMAIRRGGKIEMPLVWDFDIAFGNANHITWEQGASSVGWDGWFIKTRSPWFDRLFEDPVFVSALKQRWQLLKPQLALVPAFVKERAAQLSEAQKRNFAPVSSGGAGWNINEVMWPNFIDRGSYAGEVNYLVDFIEKRLSWLDSQIADL